MQSEQSNSSNVLTKLNSIPNTENTVGLWSGFSFLLSPRTRPAPVYFLFVFVLCFVSAVVVIVVVEFYLFVYFRPSIKIKKCSRSLGCVCVCVFLSFFSLSTTTPARPLTPLPAVVVFVVELFLLVSLWTSVMWKKHWTEPRKIRKSV